MHFEKLSLSHTVYFVTGISAGQEFLLDDPQRGSRHWVQRMASILNSHPLLHDANGHSPKQLFPQLPLETSREGISGIEAPDQSENIY